MFDYFQDDEKKDADKEKDNKLEKMDTMSSSVTSADTGLAASKSDVKAEAEVVKKPEPNFELLSNPARVMRGQLRVLRMPTGARYAPMKDVSHTRLLPYQYTCIILSERTLRSAVAEMR